MEGSGRGLISRNIPAFASSNSEKLREASFNVTNL